MGGKGTKCIKYVAVSLNFLFLPNLSYYHCYQGIEAFIQKIYQGSKPCLIETFGQSRNIFIANRVYHVAKHQNRQELKISPQIVIQYYCSGHICYLVEERVSRLIYYTTYRFVRLNQYYCTCKYKPYAIYKVRFKRQYNLYFWLNLVCPPSPQTFALFSGQFLIICQSNLPPSKHEIALQDT